MKEPSVSHSTFVIERIYPSSPDKVFAAFSDPAKKRRWMGGDDEGFVIESFEPSFQVDSYERWRFRYRGGPIIKNDTCYQDIVPNERIVFVYTMDIGERRISSSQTTVEFFPIENGTRMVFTEQGAFFDGSDGAKGREEGTRALLEQLAKELTRSQSAGADR